MKAAPTLRAAEFSVTKQVVPCNVDFPLLRVLEQYLVHEISGKVGSGPEKLAANYELTFREPTGRFSLGTIEDLDGQFLPDEVEAIEVAVRDPDTGLSVRVTFDNGKLGGKIQVTCKGPNARENANLVASNLVRITNSRKNLRGLSRRAVAGREALRLVFAFVALFSALFVGAYLLTTPIEYVKAVRAGAIAIGSLGFVLLPVLLPPFRFDNSASKNQETVVKWVLGSVGAALIGIIVQAALSLE